MRSHARAAALALLQPIQRNLGQEITVGIGWTSFVFGLLLLFVAIVGGGFEIREVKVPQVGWGVRTAAALIGIAFLVLGIVGFQKANAGVLPAPPASASPEPRNVPVVPTENPGPPAAPLDFTVSDQLGDGQITEQIRVHIDGRLVGTLTVDAAHPHSTVTVTVPRPGRYSYELASQSTFILDGETVELPGRGSGEIEVTAGKAVELRYEVGDTELLLSLV
jgi:hypothetical protein